MTPALEDSKPHSLTSRFEAASTISASAVPCSGGLKICVEGIAALGHAHRSPIRASVNLGWLPAREKRAWESCCHHDIGAERAEEMREAMSSSEAKETIWERGAG